MIQPILALISWLFMAPLHSWDSDLNVFEPAHPLRWKRFRWKKEAGPVARWLSSVSRRSR